MSELEINNGNKKLICCFGGMALQMGGIPPFEFVNYLSKVYKEQVDLLFYIDKNQCWYHKGIDGITTSIEDTVSYLNKKVKEYTLVIFMGISAGGYAAILFGSLCVKVDYIISFIPQTMINVEKYSNLKNVIQPQRKYILYGGKDIQDINDIHHIRHCENLNCFSNVIINRLDYVNLKELRDNGDIKKILDNILN
jgi:hypothetical protein